jgi:LmbE family N-acetylglucosaminyl deacetylase
VRIARAPKVFDEAEKAHDVKDAAIQAQRDSIDKRADAEQQRWAQQREKRLAALHRAKRSGG